MLFKVRSPFLVEKDYKERTTVSEIDLKTDGERLQRKALNILKEISLRDIAEQKPFVTVSHDLIVSPMKIWFVINIFPRKF